MASLETQILSKLDAARQQIEAAIELFYARRYAPAITLAGAAEGCISVSPRDDAPEPLFEAMKRGAKEQYSIESKEAVARFNAARDWLKHPTTEAPAECEITNFDAWSMIVRAVTKLNSYAPDSETPGIAGFIAYSRKHYAPVLEGKPEW